MSKLKLFGTFEYYVSINENNLEKLKQYYINMDEEDDYLEKPFGEYKILSTNNGVINLFIRKKGQFIKNVKNIETLDDEVLKYKNTTPDFESMLEEYSKELKDEINEEVKVKIANITDLGFYNFRELYDTNNFVKDVKIYNLDFVYSKEFLNQKDLKEILLSKLHEPGFITRLLNDKYLNRLYRVFLKRNKKEEVDIKDNYFSNFEENKQKFYDVERSKNEDIDFGCRQNGLVLCRCAQFRARSGHIRHRPSTLAFHFQHPTHDNDGGNRGIQARAAHQRRHREIHDSGVRSGFAPYPRELHHIGHRLGQNRSARVLCQGETSVCVDPPHVRSHVCQPEQLV